MNPNITKHKHNKTLQEERQIKHTPTGETHTLQKERQTKHTQERHTDTQKSWVLLKENQRR